MSGYAQPDRISILPGILVNQIAAGEVIERPASVVKELVENSIDAGATRIDIDIEAGGTRAIVIRDNGRGIHPEDIELAVMRHATSKLKRREDLEAIRSLGFRGEALSSIASVSDFCITSRMASGDYAHRLRLDPAQGSSELTPAAHAPGTTVEVRNLFYNVPVRRKFLRSERTEFLHIFDMVKSLIMSRLDININLRHNGRPVLTCPAVESDFRARIQTVMGGSFYQHARPIDAQAGHMQLHGWLGGPATARSQSDRQYLYLNQRMIRDRQVTHAIRMAVETEIPASRYPAYILNLRIDPVMVDVNVHPTKQEVRFRQPRDVHDFILAALGEKCASPASDNQTENFANISTAVPTAGDGARLRDTAATYVFTPVVQDTGIDAFGMPVAVLQGNHVVAAHAGELRIIDFNSLKFHYLYNRLQQDFIGKAIRFRPLLVPLTHTLAEHELQRLSACFDVLAELGLQIETMGPRSILIRSLPALLPDLDFAALLMDMTTRLQRLQGDTDELTLTLMQILARHAVNPGQHYSLQQITEELRLFSGSGLTPADRHHQGLWRTLSVAELNKLLNDK